MVRIPKGAQFNKLTAAQHERLAFLLEEMAEASHVIGKILRHGYASQDPTAGDGIVPTNREMLEHELGHVVHAIDRMKLHTDVAHAAIEASKKRKADTVGQWFHHQ